MAENSTESFVREHLAGSETSKSVREMLKTSQYTKQQLNSCLYRMLKTGEVKQDGSSPPRWELNKEFKTRDNNDSANKSETRDDIIELLEDQSLTAKDLAKKLDVGVSVVNSVLYELEKQKILKHTTTSPPVWSKFSTKDSLIDEILLMLQKLPLSEVQQFRDSLKS